MTTTVHFIHAVEADTWVARLEKYDRNALAVIRVIVPADCRRWDRRLRVWGIYSDQHAAALAARLRADGHEVEGIDLPDPAAATDWALGLLTAAPEHLRPRIVRALARVLHPDAGGVQHLMADLNDAAREVAKTG